MSMNHTVNHSYCVCTIWV